MAHSTAEKRNNTTKWPKFTAIFIYQEQLTIDKYNNLISSGTEYTLGYLAVINCAEWTNYVKTSSIGLLDNNILIVYHHQLLAADILQENSHHHMD